MNRNDILIKVASMYYEQNYTQTDIAKKMNISRPTIASMLNEAKQNGIVQINIIKTYSNILDLQEKIKAKYNLKEVLISPQNSPSPKKDVGVLCADYIERSLKGNEKIGISFGTTVHEYIKNAGYQEFNDVTITPLMGGVELKNEALHSNQLCFRLASKYNCDVNFFYAPVKAESIEQKNMLMESKLVQNALYNAKSVDIGIFGIGNPANKSTYQRLNYLSETDLIDFSKKDVIGDICTSFYNRKAEIVKNELSNHLIGLNLEDIKKIPEVIILATGTEKTVSVMTLLENNYINTLITDFELAKNLI